jgi:hypothetical protein
VETAFVKVSPHDQRRPASSLSQLSLGTSRDVVCHSLAMLR